MMIKFSWRKINNLFNWNAHNVLQYIYIKQGFEKIVYLKLNKVPRKVRWEAAKDYPRGPCFLINLDAVLREASSLNDLYIYLELASKRNIFDYKMRGITHLPKALIPEYLEGLIETNPMLEVKNGNVYFKYEQE